MTDPVRRLPKRLINQLRRVSKNAPSEAAELMNRAADLIEKEWQERPGMLTDTQVTAALQAFYGDYSSTDFDQDVEDRMRTALRATRTVAAVEIPKLCGAIPPVYVYGHGVHVEPCILAADHAGLHRPGNFDELHTLAKRWRNPNPPVYPGQESHRLRGPAIDLGED